MEGTGAQTFGRTQASDHAFDGDHHMSGRHFSIEFEPPDQVILRDLGSTNGTWLNQRVVQSAPLASGDAIRAGMTVFRVEIEDSPASGVGGQRGIAGANGISGSDSTIIPSPRAPRDASPGSREEGNPPPAAPVGSARADSDLSSQMSGTPVLRPVAARGPIESAEMSPSLLHPPVREADTGRTSSKGSANNPFSDSVDFAAVPPLTSSRAPATTLPVGGLHWLERLPQSEIAESLRIAVDLLQQRYSLRFLIHFAKIRVECPRGLRGRPVLPGWPADGPGQGPILLDWDAWKNPELAQFLPRLCRNDALMVWLGADGSGLDRQVLELTRMGLDGYSEPGGFLPVCWPSSFLACAREAGSRACEQLFGRAISGVLVCAPGVRERLVSVADSGLAAELSRHQFQMVDGFQRS